MIKCKEYIFRELYFNVNHFKLVRKLYHNEQLNLSELSFVDEVSANDLKDDKVVIIDEEKKIIYLNNHSDVTKNLIRIIRWFERT